MQKDVLYYIVRPVSQVVKTSPSHGEGRGSTPLRVTRKKTFELCSNVFFIQADLFGLAWHQRAQSALYGIAASAAYGITLLSVYPVGLIPCNASH